MSVKKSVLEEVKVTPGDKVEVVSKDNVLKGVVMPSEGGGEGSKSSNTLIIKLSNGYNVGIDPKNIQSLKIIERYREHKENDNPDSDKNNKKNNSKKNNDLPEISLVHTGGTIASKVDYSTGGVVARFSPEDIINMFPELGEIVNINSRLIGNMWTEDYRFKHFTSIAKEIIKEHKKGVNGVIVTLGTDFMTYCATALAFMLQGVNIPVILTGAQRSSDRGSSDAAMNLICASEFIAQNSPQNSSGFKGVAICMHETQSDISCAILPACKTRKMHSSRRDAFRSINTSPIARVNYETREITWIDEGYAQRKEEEEGKKMAFNPLIKMEEKIGLIKTHPNMSHKQFSCFKGYKGLVIEGSGLGHAPTGAPSKEAKPNLKILAEIQKLIKSGTIVVMTTQCIYGAVNMNIYSRGREHLGFGILQAKCLPETALLKLSWLLGNFEKDMKSKTDKTGAQGLLEKEFANEMFYRVEDNCFLI